VTELYLTECGFDLTDEGWHLSKFMHPQDVKASVLKDHLYTGEIFKLLDYNLVKLRICNILLLVGSSCFLALGLFKYLNSFSIIKNNDLLFFLSLTASIIIWQTPSLWAERSLAYNSISSFCSMSCAGLLLYRITCQNKLTSRLHIMIGAISCFMLIVRPPSGIAMLLMSAFCNIIFTQRIHLKNVLFNTCFGIVIMYGIHFLFIENPLSYFEGIRMGLEFEENLANKHDINTLIRYLLEIYVNLKFAIGYNKVVLLCLTIFSLLLLTKINYLIPVFIIATTLNFYFLGDFNGGFGSIEQYIWRYYFSLIPVFLIPLSIAMCFKKLSFSTALPQKHVFLAILFLCSPVLFSAGTHSPLTFNMNFYSSFYLTGILIFICTTLQPNKPSCNFIFLILSLLSIAPAHAALNGRLNHSFFSINSLSSFPLKDLNIKRTIVGSEVLVSENLAKAIDEIEFIFNQFKHLNISFCLNFDSPGWNFLLQIPHPIQSWTLFDVQNFTLKNIDYQTFTKSAIISSSDSTINQIYYHFPDFNHTHYQVGRININEKQQHYLRVFMPDIQNE